MIQRGERGVHAGFLRVRVAGVEGPEGELEVEAAQAGKDVAQQRPRLEVDIVSGAVVQLVNPAGVQPVGAVVHVPEPEPRRRLEAAVDMSAGERLQPERLQPGERTKRRQQLGHVGALLFGEELAATEADEPGDSGGQVLVPRT